MSAPQIALRRAAVRAQAHRSIIGAQRHWARYASSNAPRQGGGSKVVLAATIIGGATAGAYLYPIMMEQFGSKSEPERPVEKSVAKAEIQFEKPRKQATSKEENRDLLSSQHVQVKNSWEHPGIYAWGSNIAKVIDPNSNEKYVKTPRRIAYFNDQIFRDLKLTQAFGAAVTEKGDLVQWGLGFSKDDPTPVPTLTGKDIVKIDVSLDRIIALSRKGNVYSIPSSRDDLESGLKEEQPKSSWSLWGSIGKESISFRNLTPSGLGRGETVTDISAGEEHCLMLTSKGRVFSAAASALEFPSKGQMGIPGLSWASRPKGPYDQPHEITGLKGFEVSQIAAGDYHSAVLDKTGKIFTFGDNAFGQLGFDTEFGLHSTESPTLMATNNLYGSRGLIPTVTSIAAGGSTTFFTVDAKARVSHEAPKANVPQLTSDLWALGQGVYGTLGTGRWTHVSPRPTKVKTLSSLFEFDEKTNKMCPIKLKSLSIGTTHCSAVMDNLTETSVSGKGSENAINWGADVMFWGGNEHYQLGTGKRTNINAPTYIGALDADPNAIKDEQTGFHRLCVTPRTTIRLDGGKGRKVTLEQKVECGRYVTAVYSAV
ncbi:regulator of chromosome condensation 1/beta-lactamase-inhibitor protein II [Dactylonectria macrodidyma]|uniref:Regulator of chromosome condensation 1/beta-lactamase-inhibitor protein II n=1 Tax=Dactylonectria macrodidyma TaxID=307937 RepID=A0A9P9FB42_9HYPO|nr:regulator of chromosome condensation 1/beta-lactamase-inhibitor protein II [Dactylonectria macrodidyma]